MSSSVPFSQFTWPAKSSSSGRDSQPSSARSTSEISSQSASPKPFPAQPTDTITVDNSLPALAALVHELRQFREDFAPRALTSVQESRRCSLPITPSERAPVPSVSPATSSDRQLRVQVQQQALQLAAAEYQLLNAKQEARDLRHALERALAEKKGLEERASVTKPEIDTLEVLQKEFKKLREHIDQRLEQFAIQLATQPPANKIPPEAAPGPSLPVAKNCPRKASDEADRHEQTGKWDSNCKRLSKEAHPLDHPEDCECSFTCLQWAGKFASVPSLGPTDPWPHWIFSSLVGAPSSNPGDLGPDCLCMICRSWVEAPRHVAPTSVSGCHTLHCDRNHAADERCGRGPLNSIKKSTPSTHSTRFESPSTPPIKQAVLPRTPGKERNCDSCPVTLQYMLNPTASPKLTGTRSRANSGTMASSWTAPTAPSVCPAPFAVRWPTTRRVT